LTQQLGRRVQATGSIFSQGRRPQNSWNTIVSELCA